MTGKDVFGGMECIRSEFIDRAEFGSFSPEAFEKEIMKKTHIRRVLLAAAIAALICLLVGCGVVYILTVQNLKLEDREWTDPHIDATGAFTQRILSTGGPQGTNNYKAAKEWHDFEVPYAQSHDWDEDFVCPPEYELYQVNSQEMADTLEEILKKYDLKPMGPEITGETTNGLLNYLNIRQVLLPDAPAEVTNLIANYYEGGQLRISCNIQMEDGEDRWPYRTYASCCFTPKGYFDNGLFILDHPKEWMEWNYTTASGENFLILYRPNYYEGYAICDRGDRMVAVSIMTAKTLYDGNRWSDETMSPRQVEQLLDLFDFSLTPAPGDPALLSGLPAGYDAAQRSQTFDGCTITLKEAVSDGNTAWVKLGITVPEGSSVPTTDPDNGRKYWGLRFRSEQLLCDGAAFSPSIFMTSQDDGDGLDHTLDHIIRWSKQEPDQNMQADARWTLTLDGLYQQVYNSEKEQHEIQWENKNAWKFEFSFDDGCDYRAVEFLSSPTKLPAVTGQTEDDEDIWGTILVKSFTLHTNSASLLIDAPLFSGELEPQVVLRDGSIIALQRDSGFALDSSNTICRENLLAEHPIPLEEVDHILLADGTKLDPQKSE